jgi:hypothetical protein
MTIEHAIKKAESEGYWPTHVKESYVFGKLGSVAMNERELGGVFLDSLFWQSLGKAMGWEYKARTVFEGRETTMGKDDWRLRWHRFIDHLADGKGVDEFFEQLS